jgi:hypothetical protein
MKQILITLLVSLVVPLTALAAFNDVQIPSGTTLQVTVSGTVLDLTVSSGEVEALTVESDRLLVTVAAGSYIAITSADRKVLNYSSGGANVSFSCGSSSSVLTISLPNGGPITASVTPTNDTCTQPSQAAYVNTPIQPVVQPEPASEPKPAPAPAPEPAPAPTPLLASVVAVVPATEVAKPAPVAQLVSPVFNRNLQLGARGDEVRRLQELLAQDKELYPEGLITGYYGGLTREAVRRFQLKHGVISSPTEQGNGRLGPKTRAKLKEVYGEGVSKPPVEIPAAPSAAGQSLQEQIKALLEQVQALQAQIKARQGY